MTKTVAIIGGGINGAGIAWELARKSYEVTLYEKGQAGAQTSSATTKMIHGGLRYLEHFAFGLVRESLRERTWLLEHLPQLVRPIEILLPVYQDSPRGRSTIRAGLALYDLLAGRRNIASHRKWSAGELLDRAPLERSGLRGGFSYWDAQVDDAELVRLVIESARSEGATIREETPVIGLQREGPTWTVRTKENESRFDLLINAAGPWMNELLAANGIRPRYVLTLVRGSHLVLNRRVSDRGVLLQSLDDRRVFVLPWKGSTLVGTTDVIQTEALDRVVASDEEVDYLMTRFNRYLSEKIGPSDIASTFAGVRPLVGRATDPSAIGRDYRITRDENLINVFGGKMTTFMALARKVSLRVDNHFGHSRRPREPIFVT